MTVNRYMKLSKTLASQQGMSMLFMLMILGLSVGGIIYVTTDLLPKLQSEKKKAEAAINYRVFIGSVNDYLVHAIREKWCITYNSDGTTDLLQSTACSSKASMEDIVTFPGNLERVLWTSETIGTYLNSPPALESANKILAINYLRYFDTPPKTTKRLKEEDVTLNEGKLKFTITKNILEDMSTEHPLYVMATKVKDCVNKINIEVFQVRDFNNVGSGDERKVGISISTEITKTKLSCLTLRQADSISYYTFYPRRLHSFSLMKYGNLDGNFHNEFHGPVYVAGDFILPPEGADLKNSTVFYNTLTLGIYNSGTNKGSIFRTGRIVNNDKSDYTFTERGHPYLSKQDNYPNFRGFLGGVRLDATEDKGFYNLFDYSSSTSGDVASLEACIEENNALLRPSANIDSRLAYADFSSTSDSARMKLSFTKRNRFKPSNEAGRSSSSSTKDDEGEKDNEKGKVKIKKAPENRFTFDVISPEGNRALGNVSFKYNEENDWSSTREEYYGTMGVDSKVEIGINLKYFKLTEEKVSEFIEKIDSANRNNYEDVIEYGHLLRDIPEYNKFTQDAGFLNNKCKGFNRASSDCSILGYNENCDKSKDSTCDYSFQLNSYNNSRNNLKYKLDAVKAQIAGPAPVMRATLKDVEKFQGKQVLNQRYLEFSFPNEWQDIFGLVKKELKKSLRFTFTPFHYSHYNLPISFYIEGNQGNNLKFLNRGDWNDSENLTMGGWRSAYNNSLLNEAPTPVVQLDCPDGMGVADWDLDMSASTNFAWNYANTPPGAEVDVNDHSPAAPITFYPGVGSNPPLEGHAPSTTKSVVEECIIPADRTHVYGFYVCNRLIIRDRGTPLYMIGTFIVNELIQAPNATAPVYWHSIWDAKAADLIMTDLHGQKPACDLSKNLVSKTWNDIIQDPQLNMVIESCSPLDLVTNGPNNFSWTTVDPDVGIARPTDAMTSQKVNRVQKWVIREESRVDIIR